MARYDSWSEAPQRKKNILIRAIKQGYRGKYYSLVPSRYKTDNRSPSRSNRNSSGNNDYGHTTDRSERRSQTGNNDYSYGGDQEVNVPQGNSSSSGMDFNGLVNVGIAFMVLNLIISIFKS